MPTSSRELRLVVAVPTFRRPEELGRLLPMLRQQATELADDDQGPGRDLGSVEVVVVDNDPDQSARAVTTGLATYCSEPRRGLAHVRNAALAAAADADLLAWIDDDETPVDGWLGRLVELQQRTGATAVAGRVVSVPEGEVDPFVRAGGFLDRAHRDGVATGEQVSRAATNNLLLDMDFVRAHGLRFDEAFGTSGGEDSLFTGRLVAAGGTIVWCREAVVHDHVPAARMTPEYMLRRSHNMANSGVFVELALRGPRRRAAFRARHAVRELARVAQAGALLLRARARGSLGDRARGQRALARSRGALGALSGRRTAHYADPATATGSPATRSTT